MSTIRRSSFAFESLSAVTVTDAARVAVDGRSVVVNLDANPAYIEVPCGGYIPPLASTTLAAKTRVSGRLLAIIGEPAQELSESVFRAREWENFYESDHVNAPPGTAVLLKSPQDSVGYVDFVPSLILADPDAPRRVTRHEVKLNLWFSPAGTDCGIHQDHGFIETHTQVQGVGRMQKFADNTHTSIIEDQILASGQTQASLFGRWIQGRLTYPWHQYHADTDVVWLAIEYHALAL